MIPQDLDTVHDMLMRLEEADNGCLVWTGRKARGYGQYYYKGKYVYAHRKLYELFIGPIPEGMVLCHTCDNPPCCKLQHLFIGTQGDNVRDMIAKGRGKPTKQKSLDEPGSYRLEPIARLSKARKRKMGK